MTRKQRPTKVYREEITNPSRPTRNSVRQTFDPKKFQSWLDYPHHEELGNEVAFYVGAIEWRPASTAPTPTPGTTQESHMASTPYSIGQAIAAIEELETEDGTPILSEAALYDSLGKQDARRLLGRWGDLREAAGLARYPNEPTT